MAMTARQFGRLGTLALTALTLMSCTVVVDEPRPSRPDRPGPICTREYSPVCAERFGERETFSNACLAEAAGYRILRGGECRRQDPRPGKPERPDRPERPHTMCQRNYDPVCARRGNDIRTFDNSCGATALDYRIIHQGPC